jgi:Flp pilus assembly protein TadD
LKPGWWHLVNILLHTVNALLVAAVARRLLGSAFAAVLAGAVFLVHPALSEAVIWVKCRDDLLATLFALVFFAAWLDGREAPLRPPRVALLALLFLAACLSKEQAIALAAVPVAFECWTARAARRSAWVLSAWLAAFGGAFLLWRQAFMGRFAQTEYLAGSAWATLLTMTRAAGRYIELLVFPSQLLADYSGMVPSRSPLDPRVLLSVALLAAVATGAFLWRRRAAPAAFGLLWTGIFLLPVANVVPMMQYLAERFLYLPLAGFAVSVAAAFLALRRRWPTAATAAAVALVCAGGVRSAVRTADWRDSLTLFAVTARDAGPSAVRPQQNLLIQLINRGAWRDALPLARDLWTRISANPSASARAKAEQARHVGYVLLRSGQVVEGAQWIRKSTELDPSYFQTYADFGMIEGLQGNDAEALKLFECACALAPAESSAHLNRGIALRKLGRKKEAELAFLRAAACGTRDAQVYKELVALLWEQGRNGDVADVCRHAAVLFPNEHEFPDWGESAGRKAP